MALIKGLKYKEERLVDDTNTANALGSGGVNVFATPSMVAMMEAASRKCVQPYLDAGETTVGTTVNIQHLSATPVGMKVWAESELINIDGRRLVFIVYAFDEKEMIGKGEHERFIINTEKFMNKTEKKRD